MHLPNLPCSLKPQQASSSHTGLRLYITTSHLWFCTVKSPAAEEVERKLQKQSFCCQLTQQVEIAKVRCFLQRSTSVSKPLGSLSSYCTRVNTQCSGFSLKKFYLIIMSIYEVYCRMKAVIFIRLIYMWVLNSHENDYSLLISLYSFIFLCTLPIFGLMFLSYVPGHI